MSQPRDWGLEVRIFGPMLPVGLIVQFPPFPDADRQRILQSFRQRLLRDDVLLQGELQIGTYPRITVLIERPWQTFAIVFWARGVQAQQGTLVTAQLPALSVLLSGADRQADLSAIERAEQIGAEAKLPMTPANFQSLRAGVRPLAALICRDPVVRNDPSIHFAFSTVAQAFFEQFGAEGDETEAGELPPYRPA